jgi:hypothetical protein
MKQEPVRVAVFTEGGLITDIKTDHPDIEYVIIDYDEPEWAQPECDADAIIDKCRSLPFNAKDVTRDTKQGTAQLREWALESGSKKLKNRIKKGCLWILPAEEEYAMAMTKFLGNGFTQLPQDERVLNLKSPRKRDELALEAFVVSLPGHPIVNSRLVEIISEDVALERAIEITVLCPNGTKQPVYFLI